LYGLRFNPGADLLKTSLLVKHFLRYLVFLLWVAAACNDGDEAKPADIGLNYFPLQTGFYQIYAVNEIVYSAVNDPDTLQYQLQVMVVDSFPHSEGGYTYVLQRSKRAEATEPWQASETWSAKANDRELVVQEGNVPYVALTFPLRKGGSWNGNSYNNLEADEYTVDTFDEPSTVGGISFDNTAQITLEDQDDLIVYYDNRVDVYAREAGLIFRQAEQLNFCTQPDCIGQQVIESGRKYKQEIIEYGYQ
jgi:hypothetical protein